MLHAGDCLEIQVASLFVEILRDGNLGFYVCDFVDENPSFIYASQGLPEIQYHSPNYYF